MRQESAFAVPMRATRQMASAGSHSPAARGGRGLLMRMTFVLAHHFLHLPDEPAGIAFGSLLSVNARSRKSKRAADLSATLSNFGRPQRCCGRHTECACYFSCYFAGGAIPLSA